MSLADAERLRKIHTFPSLVKYLRDDLGWPIESNDFEEITFEYEPAELGLDPKTAVKVEKILQLRPLTANQPFGVFFLHFQPKHLPVVALRRILQALTLKKRASANKSDIAAWRKNDLLFISAHGEEQQRTITFAHFREDEYQPGDLPTLRVLGWDDRDTVLHIGDVHESLANKLSWPRDEDDVDAWREKWSSAFTLRHREVITTSKRLAVRLAELARIIRKRVSAVLEVEDKREGREGPLTKLHHVFKSALIHDLSEDDFADMYAQTIAYGLLSARVSRPAGLVADNITDMVPVTNPFLKEMLEEFLHVGGRKKKGKTGLDFDELGVTEVVETLRAANMEAVLRDFGDRNPQEDPVIHFYELFLKEYDAKKRMQRGVFYTPRPVVSYIVRSVHELLQTEFGLEDGLADTTTWGEMIKRFPAKPGKKGDEAREGLKIPRGTPPDQAFVQILDPATGTGTFLVEVIDVIHKTMVSKWKAQGHDAKKIAELWNDYVPKHLLPRLHGYELMMAPYAIAHMKIGLKLYETGYRFESDERARVYLTNSLEPPQDFSGHFEFDIPALAHEAKAVNEVKQRQRFTVVIGNPPYSVSSWNKGAWITGIAEVYKHTVRNEESQIQSLSNDYIKFLRFGEWHIERTSVGILGLITGHGYLQGTQPRDLRNHISLSLDRCYCIDLHGSIRRAGTDDSEDQPVFEIMTGVAILVGTRAVRHQERALTVSESLTGPLEKKFAFLSKETALSSLSRHKLYRPSPPYFHFAPSESGQDVEDEYQCYPDLPTIFGTGNRQADKEELWATGFTSQQDELAIAFTPEELAQNMSALAESKSFDDLRTKYRLCTTNQWSYTEARDFAKSRVWRRHCRQVLYRPFDRRWTVLHKHVLTILRNKVMSQFDGNVSQNLGLISSRAVNDLTFAHCFVTRERVDRTSISSRTSTNAYIFPLYFADEDLLGTRIRLNLSHGFLATLASQLGLKQDTKNPTPKGLTPEDIFQYAYAVLHSPSYRSRYAEFLKIDFPRLPLPGNLDLFRALAQLGGELVALHLLESPKVKQLITTYTGPKNPEVGRVGWSKDTVWLDAGKTNAREGHRAAKPGTIGFKGVPEQVWNFHIGGYQVCHKWLKDRKGRTLSDDDIAHYQEIVVALNETIRIMAEIDAVIDQYGGWPGAFQTGADRDDA